MKDRDRTREKSAKNVLLFIVVLSSVSLSESLFVLSFLMLIFFLQSAYSSFCLHILFSFSSSLSFYLVLSPALSHLFLIFFLKQEAETTRWRQTNRGRENERDK